MSARPASAAAASAVPPRLRLLQAIDDVAGPLLCRFAPVRSRAREPGAGEPLSPSAVRRLLVIRPGGLGDAALSFPMLAALRAHFAGAEIDILAEGRNAGVFALADDAALDVIRYDQAPLAAFRHLRARGYELVIDTEQYHRLSTLLANALRPRWLCGFGTEGRARLQTHRVAHPQDRYEAVAFLELACAVTGGRAALDPAAAFIPVPAAAQARAEELLGADPAPVVAVMPAAGGLHRRWDPQRYAAVAGWLAARGYRVALLAGADGIDAARDIAAGVGAAAIDLAGRTSLAETAAILARARLAISADTGVLHLACGVGTPTVSLFGPGRHRQWGPPGPRHRIVRLGLPCSPCTHRGRVPPCPHDIACMRDLDVPRVTQAAAELLG